MCSTNHDLHHKYLPLKNSSYFTQGMFGIEGKFVFFLTGIVSVEICQGFSKSRVNYKSSCSGKWVYVNEYKIEVQVCACVCARV